MYKSATILTLVTCLLMACATSRHAVERLTLEAQQGSAESQRDLGRLYFLGDGVAEDKAKAAEWIMKAAEQNDMLAQHYIGWMYINGDGLPKDEEKALLWHTRAGLQGNADSQHSVGNSYMAGRGVEKDIQEARRWYEMAAEQDYELSQYELGVMYALAEGVEKDLHRAADLWRKAAAQGNADAKSALAQIGIDEKYEAYSAKRMADAYYIAGLLEEYKSTAGHYPFRDERPVPDASVKTGVLVLIGSSAAEDELGKKPNPFRLNSLMLRSSHLEAEISDELGRKIELPVDPQEVASYAPNAYYVYFPVDDDEYMVLAFLHEPNVHTTELFNRNANVYAVASSAVVASYGFWNKRGVKPRLFGEITE